MTYDVVIRNGTVVDGSGLPSYPGDVAIRDGRIAAIGRVRDKGVEDVDAEGHVVTPGFVDGHTHMDAQVFWDPLGSCSCWHGVTTVVMGNCGFSLAPARPDEQHLVVRNLERAEDIPPAALAQGVPWGWEHFAEYLDAVDRVPKAINYAAYLGHSALRTWAMGERAFDGSAHADDIDAMEAELRSALAAGAVGFTTSRTDFHRTSDDRPVASRLADWDEVCRLVSAVGDAGGMFEIAQENAMVDPDPEVREAAQARLARLALDTGVPTSFGVLAMTDTGAEWREQLDMVDRTCAAGGTMFAQAHGRELTALLSFRTQLPFDALPEWKRLRAMPTAEQRTVLENPTTRRALVDAARNGAYRDQRGAEAGRPDYQWIRVLDSAAPPNPSVADLAARRGVDPVEFMIDLALASDFEQLFMQISLNRNLDDVLEIMRHPRAIMTFTDSGAHVSQLMDSSLQTHLLGYWVRQRQAFSLETAVRMITLAPARAWGFADRGLLREGMVADINVLDPSTVAPRLPTIVDDLPGGARRLVQQSQGILATLVGGEVVFREGEHTGALPGRLLRRQSRRA